MSTFVHVSVISYRTAAGQGGDTASGQVHETGLQPRSALVLPRKERES